MEPRASPSTPVGGGNTKRKDITPAKARRLRMRLLAESRGREKAQEEVHKQHKLLTKQFEDFALMIKNNSQEQLKHQVETENQLRQLAEALQEQDVPVGKGPDGFYMCPRGQARVEGPTSSCWCFELACAECEILAMFCTCAEPAVILKTCDACEHVEKVTNVTLGAPASSGYPYGLDEDDFPPGSEEVCKQCGGGAYSIGLNFVGHRDVCGHCHGVGDQDGIVPCNSSKCCGDDEAMFHETCTVKLGEDLYQCHPCRNAGQAIRKRMQRRQQPGR